MPQTPATGPGPVEVPGDAIDDSPPRDASDVGDGAGVEVPDDAIDASPPQDA